MHPDARMDPNLPAPATRKRKDRGSHPPSPSQLPPQPPPPPTSLPSFRSLYLPPPPPQQPYADERYYQPPLPTSGPGISGDQRFIPHSEPTGVIEAYGAQPGDSDQEGDGDQSGRPKQKRRRQALSCTECKRRKIKCDRAHPCGPCSRRGDQTKCQWHVIEPVDKYVSRAEYDDLKARFDRLEAIVGRMQVTITPNAPDEPSLEQPAAAAGLSGLVPAGAPDPRAALTPAPFHNPTPGPSHHTGAGPLYASGPNKPPLASFSPVVGSSYVPNLSRRPPPRPSSPPALARSNEVAGHSPPGPSSSTKPSPLSLAAITAPYNAPLQSKNCQAQTFTTLGERLRPLVAHQGPAVPIALPRLSTHAPIPTHKLQNFHHVSHRSTFRCCATPALQASAVPIAARVIHTH